VDVPPDRTVDRTRLPRLHSTCYRLIRVYSSGTCCCISRYLFLYGPGLVLRELHRSHRTTLPTATPNCFYRPSPPPHGLRALCSIGLTRVARIKRWLRPNSTPWRASVWTRCLTLPLRGAALQLRTFGRSHTGHDLHLSQPPAGGPWTRWLTVVGLPQCPSDTFCPRLVLLWLYTSGIYASRPHTAHTPFSFSP